MKGIKVWISRDMHPADEVYIWTLKRPERDGSGEFGYWDDPEGPALGAEMLDDQGMFFHALVEPGQCREFIAELSK